LPKSIQGAQSFARTMSVLQQIADAATPPSRAELLQQCGLTRPTLYRIVASLEAESLITATKDNRYALGGRLVSLARRALAQNDVREIAGPSLRRLRDITGETVHLAIRSGNDMVYIDKFESREVVRMASTIGTRVSFSSSGVGKAFLSALPVSEADGLITQMTIEKNTPFTTTDHLAVKRIVMEARAAGFVCDNQENEIGIVCFGAAICEGTDRPVASVSVSVPLFRLNEDTSQYSAPLLAAVAEISANLGFV
jgi:DNA-binding IclR family transcriptional regulator